MSSLMTVREVKKVFITGKNQLSVLKDTNLEIKKGELIMLVGPSGAGKSTLLTIMGGLSRPTQGKVLLNDVDLYGRTDEKLASIRNRKMGFAFQFHHLLPEFTALENVVMPQLIADTSQKAAEERAETLLRSLGLGARLAHNPSKLSGGEQQRVAGARALANAPKLVLADEPTGNLDEATADLVLSEFIALVRQEGSAALIATPNERLAARMDRVVRPHEGVLT